MRTKKEILDSTERNSKKATGPVDIALIHSLHTLEVLIDIRDQIHDTNYTLDNLLDPNLKKALREAGLLKE